VAALGGEPLASEEEAEEEEGSSGRRETRSAWREAAAKKDDGGEEEGSGAVAVDAADAGAPDASKASIRPKARRWGPPC
jgi:hypothetical protein